MGELEDRARAHAALGEPVRLAIVDRLGWGDISPKELGASLGLPTNLLAHHLRTLESARLIRRVRSEGDRRRSYVQLADEDDLLGLIARTAQIRLPPTERVVFVCSHNSARSQLARAAWSARSEIPAASAGTRPADRVHPRAVRVGRRHGLDLSAAVPRRIGDIAWGTDLVVAVCDNAYEELPPDAAQVHWAVPDPARLDTDAAFESACTQIIRRVDRLARAVADRPTADRQARSGGTASRATEP